ncbi:hypothetical protein [Streptomyces sp. NBC_01589]|uniref:hypothetical protein n=1 Tax=unclassified Streptomyces TaxID=2593676 RepID=UPI00386A23C0
MLTLVALVTTFPRDTGDAGPDSIGTGRVCRSTLPADLDLSCGTYGFGDMRYLCPKP